MPTPLVRFLPLGFDIWQLPWEGHDAGQGALCLRTGVREVTVSILVNQAEIGDSLTFQKKPPSHPSRLPPSETQQPAAPHLDSPGGRTQVTTPDAQQVGSDSSWGRR